MHRKDRRDSWLIVRIPFVSGDKRSGKAELQTLKFMHIRKLQLVARFVFPTVIALNFSFFSRIQLWLQMNHACGSTLCRYPFFPLPFRSIFYLYIYHFSSSPTLCSQITFLLVSLIFKNHFFNVFLKILILLTVVKTDGKITRVPFLFQNLIFYINLSLELRTFVTELSSPKNERRGCTLFPQDEKRGYVSCSVDTKRIVPSRDSRKLVVMTTKIRKEQVIFTRQLSPNPRPLSPFIFQAFVVHDRKNCISLPSRSIVSLTCFSRPIYSRQAFSSDREN